MVFVSINDVLKERFIMRKEGSGTKKIFTKELLNKKISLQDLDIIAHVESLTSIKEMVKCGLGVSIVSYISIIDEVDNKKFKFYRIKDFNLKRKFYFVYSKKRIPTPLEERFIEYLMNYFNKKK